MIGFIILALTIAIILSKEKNDHQTMCVWFRSLDDQEGHFSVQYAADKFYATYDWRLKDNELTLLSLVGDGENIKKMYLNDLSIPFEEVTEIFIMKWEHKNLRTERVSYHIFDGELTRKQIQALYYDIVPISKTSHYVFGVN